MNIAAEGQILGRAAEVALEVPGSLLDAGVPGVPRIDVPDFPWIQCVLEGHRVVHDRMPRSRSFLLSAIRGFSLIGLCLLSSGCVYISRHTLRGACLTDMNSPVRNFCVVAPQILWRGERPTREDAQWLLEERVGTVVSLQLDDQAAFKAVRLDPDYSHSVTYYKVSGFSPLQLLSPSHLDEHLALFIAIVKAAPKPVYVHCRAGVDRTGILSAAYRVLIDGATRREAVAEMGRYHSPWQTFDARYIYGLSEARREKILRKAADWESRIRPTANIECAHGRCTYVPNPEPVGARH